VDAYLSYALTVFLVTELPVVKITEAGAKDVTTTTNNNVKNDVKPVLNGSATSATQDNKKVIQNYNKVTQDNNKITNDSQSSTGLNGHSTAGQNGHSSETTKDIKSGLSVTIHQDTNDTSSSSLKEPTTPKRFRSHSSCDLDLNDPFCNPNNPTIIRFQDIGVAGFNIRGGVEHTPCPKSHMSALTGINIYFKKDYMQYTGSFKERGARFVLMMLSSDQKRQGVIAASAGNHALALAYHGNLLKVPVTVVMPTIAPMMKVKLCKQFGANVIIQGHDLSESKVYAMRLARQDGML